VDDKKLSNEIVDMKRSVGEGNQNQIPYKTFFKRSPPFNTIEPPPTNLNIDLENIAYESFCTYHQEKHSERDFPQGFHAINLMANRFLDECSLTEEPSGLEIGITYQESQEPP
jgi:hypothetical protein